jgi:hypothetical protein
MGIFNVESTSSSTDSIKKLAAKALVDDAFRGKLFGTDWQAARLAISGAKLGFTDSDAEAIAKKTTSLTAEQKKQFYDDAQKLVTTAQSLMLNASAGLW